MTQTASIVPVMPAVIPSNIEVAAPAPQTAPKHRASSRVVEGVAFETLGYAMGAGFIGMPALMSFASANNNPIAFAMGVGLGGLALVGAVAAGKGTAVVARLTKPEGKVAYWTSGVLSLMASAAATAAGAGLFIQGMLNGHGVSASNPLEQAATSTVLYCGAAALGTYGLGALIRAGTRYWHSRPVAA